MLKPLMQSVLERELKTHPEKEKSEEEKAAALAQELLERLWTPEQKPLTFWKRMKSSFSENDTLPQKLFRRILEFREQKGLVSHKKEMQQVMFYAVRAFREGTEMMAAGCYLFNHNPLAFEKYATSAMDFEQDIQQRTSEEEKNFMPQLETAICAKRSPYKGNAADDQCLPLFSFTPIKNGLHPCLMESKWEINKYKELFHEFSLQGFKTDPYRYTPLKKLFLGAQSACAYPAFWHKSIVDSLNEFNKHLAMEPVRICAHKKAPVFPNRQKTL
ncbi:MAG: hypothetical protein ACI4OR_04200 [Alphaproteobacteria bacterium]